MKFYSITHDFTPDGSFRTFKVAAKPKRKRYDKGESDRPFKEEAARMAKLKPKAKTYHEGANDERSSILAIVRRMVKDQPPGVDVMISGTTLIKKLLTRVKRNKTRVGGL